MLVRSRTVRLAAVLAALVLVAAACGDDDDSDVASSGDQTTEATETTEAADPYSGPGESSATTAADDAASGAAEVEVGDSDLGEVLTSGGLTLYIFTPDDGGESTCYDDCATTWPPLVASGDVSAGDGLDSALFGTTERKDGSMQVTVDGWPLYFFASDAAAGDVNGQGLGGNWWVVGPDGAAIMD